MQIILLEKIKKLGKIGDVVKVKPGFARNFLLPRKKALSATKENLQIFEKQKAQLEKENNKNILEAEKIKKKIVGVELIVLREASENGNLYGSVTKRDIASELKKLGLNIEQSQIDLTKIKEIGIHKCTVDIHPEVKAELKLNIAKTAGEAKAISGNAKNQKKEEAKKIDTNEDEKTKKIETSVKAKKAPDTKKKAAKDKKSAEKVTE